MCIPVLFDLRMISWWSQTHSAWKIFLFCVFGWNGTYWKRHSVDCNSYFLALIWNGSVNISVLFVGGGHIEFKDFWFEHGRYTHTTSLFAPGVCSIISSLNLHLPFHSIRGTTTLNIVHCFIILKKIETLPRFF